ncbi:MAG TPA: DUF1415 domain-containing protein [Bacteroidia bacterium]|nr:DUF1415 domain-containing protein [Bacteroidia bacterium]
MKATDQIIRQTKKWITDVVVGLNFCPFAAKELRRGTIHFEVILGADVEGSLESLGRAFVQLDEQEAIETTLLVFPDAYSAFDEYLDLVHVAEALLLEMGYEGIYQIASFHPDYLFEGSTEDDPANYTNRSPYPMLHLLREQSLSAAIDSYPGAENIPQRNIEQARKMGLMQMKVLRDACFI